MSYFVNAYEHIRYPVQNLETETGLRKSQLGAIHAISAHFTLHERAALVVLPTGAGKTAVLMLTPYVLSAKRALVITRSRFVREQIAKDYNQLLTLKRAGVFANDLPHRNSLLGAKGLA